MSTPSSLPVPPPTARLTPKRPYQPSLLRFAHGVTLLLTLAAWSTGLVVLAVHDRRWFTINLPTLPSGDWIDVHGSIGVVLLPFALLLLLVACTLGRRRLNRPGNLLMLLSLALAVASGKAMQEEWLRQGDLEHLAYGVHLLAWMLMPVALVQHLLSARRLGGPWLVMSMLALNVRQGDGPRHWWSQISRHLPRRTPS